jgi:hypothetical protein
VMLAKQIYEIALDNNPGTPRFHGTCNALVNVNIGTDAAKRDTGAKATDRSACDRNGEVGLCVPVHYRTSYAQDPRQPDDHLHPITH